MRQLNNTEQAARTDAVENGIAGIVFATVMVCAIKLAAGKPPEVPKEDKGEYFTSWIEERVRNAVKDIMVYVNEARGKNDLPPQFEVNGDGLASMPNQSREAFYRAIDARLLVAEQQLHEIVSKELIDAGHVIKRMMPNPAAH